MWASRWRSRTIPTTSRRSSKAGSEESADFLLDRDQIIDRFTALHASQSVSRLVTLAVFRLAGSDRPGHTGEGTVMLAATISTVTRRGTRSRRGRARRSAARRLAKRALRTLRVAPVGVRIAVATVLFVAVWAGANWI